MLTLEDPADTAEGPPDDRARRPQGHHHSSRDREQGSWFDALQFFPTLTKELLDENRAWLEPTFIDPANGGLILCVQSFVIKTPHHNILIDSCVGNHKPRKARPFWHMLDSDRFERSLPPPASVDDIDYVMCTHLHGDHVGWNTRLDNGRGCRPFPTRNT